MTGSALTLAALLAATVTSGLLAGVYVLYAHTVMPGLRTLDDRTFVAAFQALDRAIVNPWFVALGFLGAPVLTAVALARTWGEPAAAWVASALVLHVVAMVVTARVHLPRNDAVKAAGDPDTLATGDLAALRSAFDEAGWVRWNLLRAVTSVARHRPPWVGAGAHRPRVRMTGQPGTSQPSAVTTPIAANTTNATASTHAISQATSKPAASSSGGAPADSSAAATSATVAASEFRARSRSASMRRGRGCERADAGSPTPHGGEVVVRLLAPGGNGRVDVGPLAPAANQTPPARGRSPISKSTSPSSTSASGSCAALDVCGQHVARLPQLAPPRGPRAPLAPERSRHAAAGHRSPRPSNATPRRRARPPAWRAPAR